MKSKSTTYFLRFFLILVGLVVFVGGAIYMGLNPFAPAPAPSPLPQVTLPILATPTPLPIPSPTPTDTAVPTAVATTPKPTATSRAELPTGGIVYALSPDINSVGWVQTGEEGNHFGESYLYAGIRQGETYLGALQFDLSFIPVGSTIFMAELELAGLVDEGLTEDNVFVLNILTDDIDGEWARHDFEIIQTATIDEALDPVLEADDLAPGRANKFVWNAAQRSIIEDRLETTRSLSLRLDSLFAEGWFGWDTGYGPDTQGQGPILRLGVLPPVATATQVAETLAGGTPTSTATFIVITSTPTPENMLTAAAMAPAATFQATTTGTPTPLPENWVTPWVVTTTPTPENTATALFQVAEATAAVIAYGTSTPTPQNLVTATPEPTETPTPVFILLDGELPPMTPTPTPVATLGPTPPIPSQLIGKIAFKSDRSGREEFYVINPDGTELALLTNRWPYNMAELADTYSTDGRYRVFTKDAIRYVNVELDGGGTEGVREDAPALYWYDSFYKEEKQLTNFGTGIAYGGVWSPSRERIAFVSNTSGDDEIWLVNSEGSDLRQLTKSNEAQNAQEIGKDTFIPEVNKHPSWSPDGSQIVFWSNRTGHGQIWVMDTDGNNLFSLSRTGFNDWDPVWIKYPGLPAEALEKHTPYIGPYDPSGSDKNCDDFNPAAEPHESAQAFYLASGGPARDPHALDEDSDGLACE
jgi:hypothetical protein